MISKASVRATRPSTCCWYALVFEQIIAENINRLTVSLSPEDLNRTGTLLVNPTTAAPTALQRDGSQLNPHRLTEGSMLIMCSRQVDDVFHKQLIRRSRVGGSADMHGGFSSKKLICLMPPLWQPSYSLLLSIPGMRCFSFPCKARNDKTRQWKTCPPPLFRTLRDSVTGIRRTPNTSNKPSPRQGLALF